jgi:hypothetical protein
MPIQTMAQKIDDFLIPVEGPRLQPFLLIPQEKRQHLFDAGPCDRREMQNFFALAHLYHHCSIPLYSRSARRAIAKIASRWKTTPGTVSPASFPDPAYRTLSGRCNFPASITNQYGITSLDRKKRDEEQAQIMVDPLYPSLGQSACRANPPSIVHSDSFGLNPADQEEHLSPAREF